MASARGPTTIAAICFALAGAMAWTQTLGQREGGPKRRWPVCDPDDSDAGFAILAL